MIDNTQKGPSTLSATSSDGTSKIAMMKLRGGQENTAVANLKLIYRPHSDCGIGNCGVCSGDSDVSQWTVSLVGSWSKWLEKHTASWNPAKGVFEAQVVLPIDSHEFKFVVNDQWVTGPDYDTQANSLGANNVLIITASNLASLPSFVRSESASNILARSPSIDGIQKKAQAAAVQKAAALTQAQGVSISSEQLPQQQQTPAAPKFVGGQAPKWKQRWQQKAEQYTTAAANAQEKEKQALKVVVANLRKEVARLTHNLEASDKRLGEALSQNRGKGADPAMTEVLAKLALSEQSRREIDVPFNAALEKVADLSVELTKS